MQPEKLQSMELMQLEMWWMLLEKQARPEPQLLVTLQEPLEVEPKVPSKVQQT